MLARMSSNRVISMSVIGVLLVSIPIGYLILTRSPFDDRIQAVFKAADLTTAYSQAVRTETDLGDRRLVVEGRYYIDRGANVYASSATTTLILHENDEEHSFSLDTLALSDRVYARVWTESSLLAPTLPASEQWREFKRGEVPEEFTLIARDGPIVDNLALFRSQGLYLDPLSARSERTLGSDQYFHYTFRLSEAALNERGGILGSHSERLGPEGVIEAYLSKDTGELRFIVLRNAPYVSTTTLDTMNITHLFAPPSLSEVLD